MALPEFNSQGDLPPGVHQATLEEVVARFGDGSANRRAATTSLLRIHAVAAATAKFERLVIFGSYVTSKQEPNDVDVVLVMADDFKWAEQVGETRDLFDHHRAGGQFGASVFWVRPAAILVGSLDEFIAQWQVKRDRTCRGIVEVRR